MNRRFLLASLAMGVLAVWATYLAVQSSRQVGSLSEIEGMADPGQAEAIAEMEAHGARVVLLIACVMWLLLALVLALAYARSCTGTGLASAVSEMERMGRRTPKSPSGETKARSARS